MIGAILKGVVYIVAATILGLTILAAIASLLPLIGLVAIIIIGLGGL